MAEVGHAADRPGSQPEGNEKEKDQYTRPEKPLCPAVSLQHPLLIKTHIALFVKQSCLLSQGRYWRGIPAGKE